MHQLAAESPAEIRILDLAEPVLTADLIAMRRGPLDFPDYLSVDDVLARATAATDGLTDFGAETGFRERLGIWLESWNEDDGLTRGGRILLLQYAVRVMANRLRVEDIVKRHPEILDIEIDRPIIIAGLPRSGTTHLVNWLARDTRLHSLTVWESQEPVPVAELKPGESDPRMARAADAWEQLKSLLPLMPAMHEMEASSIHEDNELLFMDVNSYNWEWQSRVPRWIDYYFTHERTGSYLYEKKVLQVLTWFRGPKRWILKSPQHMENLAAMKVAFPDATMVITHRDPVAVMASLLTMVSYGDRLWRDPVDPPGSARLWIDRIERLLRECLAQRDVWPADQSIDVLFHEYMADQESVMRRVYDMARLELTPEMEKTLLSYLAENPRNKHGKVLYDLQGDFGVDPAELRERFRFYTDIIPVREER